MPLPKPNKKKENKAEFVSRCLSSETMQKEYPDKKQRVAICYKLWKDGTAKICDCEEI